MASLVVPLLVCVSDSPQIVLGMPNTFPNPTYGPTNGNGLGNCNSVPNPPGGNNNACALTQPSNLIPGFPQTITEMVLAISGGSSASAAVTTAPINLLAQTGNSSQICKILDIHTDGGVVFGATIAPIGVQFATIQPLGAVQGGAVFLGPASSNPAPNSLPATSVGPQPPTAGFPYPFPTLTINGINFFDVGIDGLGLFPGLGSGIGGTPGFAAGPIQVIPAMQTFAICVNTDPVGNASGTFPTTVTINGAGVGPIIIPVNMIVSTAGVPPPPGSKFSNIGIFRGSQGLFALDENGNNAFDLPGDRLVQPFGQPGDIPVAGDWDGTGVIRIGVYRPANGHWYLDLNNNGHWDGAAPNLDLDIQFGAPSATCVPTTSAGLAACQDIPIVGDWNGSGISKLGIFRNGQFFLDNAAPTAAGAHTSFTTFNFGQPGDIPVAANWNGACTSSVSQNPPCPDQIGVFRRGTWFVNATGDGVFHAGDPVYTFGQASDIPVVGNWNGTGGKRIGVFSATGTWFVDINGDHVFTSPTDQTFNFGEPGDLPLVGTWTLP